MKPPPGDSRSSVRQPPATRFEFSLLAAGVHHLLQRPHRRPEAPVLPDRELYPRPVAGVDDGARVGDRERERLLAEDVLPGLRGGERLLAMQRVRRGEHHRLDRAVAQRIVEMAAFERIDRSSETDALALRGRRHQALAPAAQADDRRLDHSGSMPACLMSRDHFSISFLM